MRNLWSMIGASVLATAVAAAAEERYEDFRAPTVRSDRPRVFLREKAWDGPALERVRTWMGRPEYQFWLGKLPSTTIGQVLLFKISGEAAQGVKAVEAFKRFQIGGDTPSYAGIEMQKCAAMYDWLRDHPEFDDASRTAKIAHMEKWADDYLRQLKTGGPSTPFYSRVAGALSGVTAVGLALSGDSPKADEYVKFAAWYLRNKFGTIRQMEDGATGGGSYGYHHEFTDCANIAALWRSATDWDAARWIKENQGDWLQRQLLYQVWTTYPNGWFMKDGDIWSGSHMDNRQFRMQVDTVTSMYRNGLGRAWADVMHSRYPKADPTDYHREFVWQFYAMNDPTVPAAPLADLGRAAVFSPQLHGFVIWRDSWQPDAAIVSFKCGETVDHHATYDQGKFMIFKRTPLAIKAGGYLGGYKGSHHLYYKSVWSANCVIFTGEVGGKPFAGEQPFIDFDGTPSWSEWKAARDQQYKRPPTGVLRATEATEQYARALGDLTGACQPGSSWTREMVFLGYKYVLVLDRVKAAPGLKHRWTLHTVNEPKTEGMLITADNAPGRLFCKTLLPEKATLAKVGGPDHEFDYNGTNRPHKQPPEKVFPEMQLGAWRLDVTPADDTAECVYLHVLVPTDTEAAAMPPCSVERRGADLVVQVADLTYTFTPRE
jgi:hypothetical protein